MRKGKIDKVGDYSADKGFTGWKFSNCDVGLYYKNYELKLIAGYTIEELIDIYNGSAK